MFPTGFLVVLGVLVPDGGQEGGGIDDGVGVVEDGVARSSIRNEILVVIDPFQQRHSLLFIDILPHKLKLLDKIK